MAFSRIIIWSITQPSVIKIRNLSTATVIWTEKCYQKQVETQVKLLYMRFLVCFQVSEPRYISLWFENANKILNNYEKQNNYFWGSKQWQTRCFHQVSLNFKFHTTNRLDRWHLTREISIMKSAIPTVTFHVTKFRILAWNNLWLLLHPAFQFYGTNLSTCLCVA